MRTYYLFENYKTNIIIPHCKSILQLTTKQLGFFQIKDVVKEKNIKRIHTKIKVVAFYSGNIILRGNNKEKSYCVLLELHNLKKGPNWFKLNSTLYPRKR